MNKDYQAYQSLIRKIKDLHSASAVLQWDMETYMPPKGSRFRAQQLATLQGMAHELFTAESTGALLEKLMDQKDQLDTEAQLNVSLSLEDYQKATKLPIEFVKKQSMIRSAAGQAWLKAREAKDYRLFQSALQEVVENKREESALRGEAAHPYDNLMDTFEKGATIAKLDPLFKEVREKLVAFTQEIRENGKAKVSLFLEHHYNKDQQWDFGIDCLKQMGYDFEAGRQDISEHPFTTNFSPEDVRVTTRIDEKDLMTMIGSCIHEGGHALYEQGLPVEHYGLPLGDATSLGIHESQSRLWENNVGMSLAYWEANFDRLHAYFPSQLAGISPYQFYQAINQVQPNLIRIEADELHYHLHILIRYELEKALMEGSLDTENLNEEWNRLYKEYLGVDVPNDKMGVLQDVHWSHALIGYFPTYSLGSFYAAQFFQKAMEEIPNLMLEIKNGRMQSLLAWLQEKIYRHGRRYTSEELCKQITGEGLNVEYFMNYARAKYGAIYEL